ncbi:hypothetical protein, partial [Serratia marcescens]|uniref:hypothetical protein n=1 Tax=Serratia marcescens TaxID=615 RepID=UPI0019542CBB
VEAHRILQRTIGPDSAQPLPCTSSISWLPIQQNATAPSASAQTISPVTQTKSEGARAVTLKGDRGGLTVSGVLRPRR